jgi:hypothetical protein
LPRFLKEVRAPTKVLIIRDISDTNIDFLEEETLTKKVKIRWD